MNKRCIIYNSLLQKLDWMLKNILFYGCFHIKGAPPSKANQNFVYLLGKENTFIKFQIVVFSVYSLNIRGQVG